MFRAIIKRQCAVMPSQERVNAALKWLGDKGPVDFVIRYGTIEFDEDMPVEIERTLDTINFCDRDLRPEGLVYEIHSYEDWGLPGTVSYMEEETNG